MVLTGKQKAAMLLMSLDAPTAAELLRGVDANTVQELAVELAYLDASGYRSSGKSYDLAKEFCDSLQAGVGFHAKSFLNEMLKSTVGEKKAVEIQTQISNLLQKRDPFMPIRNARPEVLGAVLGRQHPQAIAVVLSELPAKASSEILGMLGEELRFAVISRMASPDSVTGEARLRIAEMVCRRLEAAAAGGGEVMAVRPEQSLRKVAVILRNVGKELRDGLLNEIKAKDARAGAMVTRLMVMWEDMPQVTDRSLREALRGVEGRKLALALTRAGGAVVNKVKANITERAAAALAEEAALMAAPAKSDVEAAREEIVGILRKMNEAGELVFVEE
jgi:flagellar motor switch protein FliG